MAINAEIRQASITGTRIAAIAGVDTRADAFSVWADMKGRLERRPRTMRMRLGKLFERLLCGELYEELTGRATEFRDETVRDPDRPYFAGSPDAVCINEPRIVDAKLVAWDQRPQWGDSPDEIPAYVQCQVAWYMARLRYPRADVIALVGDEPMLYPFERDLDLERMLDDIAEEFYRRYIVGDEVPPIGSSPDSARYLKERFPRHRFDLREASPEESALLDAYSVAREEADDALDERERLENQIKLCIGDSEGLSWERGRFTWRNTKDSVGTDWKALAASLMRGYSDEERKAYEGEFSLVKPGVRRIHFARRSS